MDFWFCDSHADYQCSHGVRRCGKAHATPKPRDVLFDDLVRRMAAGTIVPVEFRTATKLHRFWITSADRGRLEELREDDSRLPPPEEESRTAPLASTNRPTCRIGTTPPPPALQSLTPARPVAPPYETGSAGSAVMPTLTPPAPEAEASRTGLPASMVALQRAADRERAKLGLLESNEERTRQRKAWFEAAAAARDAVTRYARAKRLNRVEVAQELRRAAGVPQR
ncbi:hypothetical protein [Streptomyces phaeofaciens]|uniref:hypothetical protein n=1 Tax=Streptomyces phaeofaciens TaxID=68254 RepID=UPI0036C9A870